MPDSPKSVFQRIKTILLYRPAIQFMWVPDNEWERKRHIQFFNRAPESWCDFLVIACSPLLIHVFIPNGVDRGF